MLFVGCSIKLLLFHTHKLYHKLYIEANRNQALMISRSDRLLGNGGTPKTLDARVAGDWNHGIFMTSPRSPWDDDPI